MSNTGNTGNTGNKIGDTIKGVLNAGHGAGETIRGTINQTLDSAGEGLRQGSSDTHTARDAPTDGKSADYAGNHSQRDVTQNGADEFKQGIDSIAGAFGKDKPHSSA
ncbi:short-chain acyl-CoA dehydrogenase [Moesziomyces antarcticus T-34]|uniref:Short-chain acyl-CoA dehydrogenase n=1 Tax=Pseudozyma antarctica (strain T-34) TaxID=1151754 RepID=M9M7K1_PSEA3|nr:short-chain acyl-CoA dehydrogenase [Moesziomyces antarcticus T-34]